MNFFRNYVNIISQGKQSFDSSLFKENEALRFRKGVNGLITTILWAVCFAVFVIIEICTFELVSIWLAAGALISMFMSIFDAPFWSQFLVFAVASAVLLAATRPLARKLLKEVKPTNTELDIGKTCVVTEEINNKLSQGRVNLSGVFWAARSYDNKIIPEGSVVIVTAIDGAKLIVDKDGD